MAVSETDLVDRDLPDPHRGAAQQHVDGPPRRPARSAATFLVTGGCGFIGYHLCVALRADGHGVRVLDDLSTGKRANLVPGAELLQGDVADPSLVRAAMAGVDGCFHLAAVASVERSRQDWQGTHRVNLGGTIAVFDAARAVGPRPVPVVYASSAAVYGDNANSPLREDAIAAPLSAYGADKLGCELHGRVATLVHGVPTIGLRFFNVYGPRQDPSSPYSGVISIFCDRLRAGRSVTIFGDGRQSRDFVCVADVVRALRAAMHKAQFGGACGVYNVCTGHATTVLELVAALGASVRVTPSIVFAAARPGEVRHSVGDPNRLAADLGVRAMTRLADGLLRTLSDL